MLGAAWRILLRFPLLHVAIALAGKVFSAKTPVVFIGNNEYEVNVLARSLGVRKRIDRGLLAVYTLRTTSRLKMLWITLKELFREGEPPELEMHAVDHADIVATARSCA
jgi:diacylglycerol kinase family enzyme